MFTLMNSANVDFSDKLVTQKFHITPSFQVALITVINLSHSSAAKCTSSIEMQCVQTAEGKIYSIKVRNVM